MGSIRRGSALSPAAWFAKYSILQCVPLIVLAAMLVDKDGWFIALSIWLTGSVGILAWRSSDKAITRRWWFALAIVLALSLGMTTLVVLSMPGSTKYCAPRYVRGHVWERTRELPPDPSCQGVRLVK